MAEFFLSNTSDPFENLAIEDFILRRNMLNGPVLLCYINRPSVVIGRFQNPWLEMNWRYMQENGIEFVRRQSGGGTVYHDTGNLNFCFIHPGRETKKEWNHQVICSALSNLGVPVVSTPRGDLLLEGKKISGSAFKQTKDSSFHHGTILLHSDLDTLRAALKPTLEGVVTKSIPSVRSSVTCIGHKNSTLTKEDIFSSLLDSFGRSLNSKIEQKVFSLSNEVSEKARFWKDWNWRWAETPKFTWNGMLVEKGRLNDGRPFDQLVEEL